MILTILTIIAAAVFLIQSVAFIVGFLGGRTIRILKEIEPITGEAPSVSVIIAARDEARNVEEAFASVLGLDYPDLEVVAVDDRSTDGTGEILERMASGHENLKVLHIHELPSGWLGKCHALQRGADVARGEYLLFTDADVVFEPSTLRRALTYVRDRNLDHLASGPEMIMPGVILKAFGASFGILLGFFMMPWKARDPKSKRFIGIGAFNLVRTEAYLKAGGHEAIRLRPDDDIMLGKILKMSGAGQDIVFGRELISVEWYSRVREMVCGLEKNCFAGIGYSVFASLGAVLSLLVLDVLPFIGIFLLPGAGRWFCLGAYLIPALLIILSVPAYGLPRWTGLTFPLSAALFAFIIFRSMVVVIKEGGITWRDTFYPLDELKKFKV